MSKLNRAAKEKRYEIQDETTKILSSRIYNMILGCTVLYGILINVFTCLFFKEQILTMNMTAFLIGYGISCFAGILIAYRNHNPIISFIGYNLVVVPVGVLLSLVIYVCADIDPSLILHAFIITAFITFCMITLSIIFPDFFSKLGIILLVSLLGLLIIRFIFMFCHIDSIIESWIGAGIFSLYIGYDYWKSQQYIKTIDNAIDSAVDIYLDIINLFLNILKILLKNND